MASEGLSGTLIVDASIGLKWVVPENGTGEAFQIVRGRRLLVPALFWLEAANALASKVRRGVLTAKAAAEAFEDLKRVPLETVEITPALAMDALAIANRLGHTVYDCAYLVLAASRDAVVMTADRRFAAAVSADALLAHRVRLLPTT
ncbi:MAG TPA: type II toxin-antitoxin system VapC family toxin [Azospirillaceae bacterium]|nr:type II toxin-antitoxin system VapC family toxin [Azospirillaceae bacterium]